MRPARVPRGGAFHLDDLRAHPCEATREERAREKVAVVDDADPAKRRVCAGGAGVGPLGHGASVGKKQLVCSYTGLDD